MARNVVTATGACNYTVPAGKIAKVIIKRVVVSGTGASLDITVGGYEYSQAGDGSTNTLTYSSTNLEAQGDDPVIAPGGETYIIVSYVYQTNRTRHYVVKEHIIMAGEQVSITGGSTLDSAILIIEEDI